MASPNQPAYYRAQAQAMRDQAEDSALDNVRDRCLRSAEAWTEMADRAERHQRAAARTEEAKKVASAEAEAASAAVFQGTSDHFR